MTHLPFIAGVLCARRADIRRRSPSPPCCACARAQRRLAAIRRSAAAGRHMTRKRRRLWIAAGLRPRPGFGDRAGAVGISATTWCSSSRPRISRRRRSHPGEPSGSAVWSSRAACSAVRGGRPSGRAVPRHRWRRQRGRDLCRHPARPVPRGSGRRRARRSAAGRHVPRLRGAGQARRDLHAEGGRRGAEEKSATGIPACRTAAAGRSMRVEGTTGKQAGG